MPLMSNVERPLYLWPLTAPGRLPKSSLRTQKQSQDQDVGAGRLCCIATVEIAGTGFMTGFHETVQHHMSLAVSPAPHASLTAETQGSAIQTNPLSKTSVKQSEFWSERRASR